MIALSKSCFLLSHEALRLQQLSPFCLPLLVRFTVEILLPFPPGCFTVAGILLFFLRMIALSKSCFLLRPKCGGIAVFAFLSAAAYFIVETLFPFPPGASLPESCCSFSV